MRALTSRSGIKVVVNKWEKWGLILNVWIHDNIDHVEGFIVRVVPGALCKSRRPHGMGELSILILNHMMK